ncbi:two-component sensor histidine kinase, partial [Mycolicibacterium sp. KC 300]|nr:two-component sensor histidine kinase [Mycolicibacterium arseniciresistens]
MSSSPLADPGVVGRTRMWSPRTWSLRVRLLVTQVVLLALVCAVVGLGTVFMLQRFLSNQLDAQVVEAGRRSVGLFGPPPPGFPPPPGMRPPPDMRPPPGFPPPP